MAGKATRHATTAGVLGAMDTATNFINTLSTGANIWQMGQPDTLTQPDNTPANTFIEAAGDNMTGIFGISSWSSTSTNGSLYQLEASTEILDLARDEMHASRWIWIAGSSTVDKLSKISNAEFDGQLLFIESIDGQTPTLRDKDDGTVIAGANIQTLSGSDFDFPSTKTIVMLMYSIIDSNWHMVTAGSASGANTTLSNLGTTSINAHLIPDGNQYLGSATDDWDKAYINDLYLYSSTTSASTKTLGGYFRVYTDDNYKWVAYYN